MKKGIIWLLNILIIINITGCSIWSALTGEEELVMKEVSTKEKSSLDDTIVDDKIIKSESQTSIAIQMPTTQITINENKQGNISHKCALYTAPVETILPKQSIIDTEDSLKSLITILNSYSSKDENMNLNALFSDYFYIIIPLNNFKTTWSYYLDSVKNQNNLTITTMCEKNNNENASSCVALLVIAISRKDIPNIPLIDSISIKENSYTIK